MEMIAVRNPVHAVLFLILAFFNAAGLFVLRRRPGYNPEYRTWGYPFVPLAFIVVSLAIVINQFAVEPLDAAAGLGLVVIGAPVYYWRHANR